MANCCGAARCTCRVTAGPGITVEGNGSAGAPYVISGENALTAVEAVDTPTVDTTVTGTGAADDPYVVSASVILDLAPPGGGDNLVQAGPGGLYVECADVRGCLVAGTGIAYDPGTGEISATGGAAEPLVTEDSTCIALTGDGTAGAPLTASPILNPAPGNALTCGPDGLLVTPGAVSCDDVRPCLSAGDGIAYDEDTGEISARPSTDAGNVLEIGSDGGLHVPTPAALATGCGLTGDGTEDAPLAVVTGTWEYDCAAEDAGTPVVCDANGDLRGMPEHSTYFEQFTEARDYANLPVPAGFDVVADTFTWSYTNPDPCRPVMVFMEREADVDFDLPAGAGAAAGQDTDEMNYIRNTGTTTILDYHVHGTKVYRHQVALAPGATANVSFPVTIGRGVGGATYNRIQVFLRAMMHTI
ncbi:hypothetical protein GCM10010250_22270 [Streptomyces althioticus]|uniref:hypothetical protein n=1 Tax=Streptomyces althioticus TaxID=83380 RepID=UPI00187611E5|nr:hypothetical protein GCM10010250_22270 [Streptomyces althioticus]